ncbi:MAG: trypsin-like peptidase domain-containing protein [Thiothrix sp.]|nr:trypsin-like peptidase domain-containing protein [Thiothrix sp.]HPQ95757.1 serine protease [Thiolinea sp.]
MYRQCLTIIGLVCYLFCSFSARAETRSSSLYNEVEKSIYQVRVINHKTGNKSVIGSGFVVARPDIMATNYHVVSTYTNDPETFSMNYLSTTGETGPLYLVDVDVLHDLAILKADAPLGKPLKTSVIPEKGATLYSLGNPLDLGFSIVTGTNNGMVQNSEDNNILFSGNLNSGMSGGPALNESGEVIGINVATAGNDVSFLVSVQYLNILLERLRLRGFSPAEDLHGSITRQLHDNSIERLLRLQDNDWKRVQIGQFEVPGSMDRTISCWDSSDEARGNSLMGIYAATCSNELRIFLDEKLSIGEMRYQYTWYESDGMISPRFYRQYEYQNASGLINTTADKKNVSRFECRTRFVAISGHDFKMTVCRRDYLRYQGLSDVLVTGAMVAEPKVGLIFDFYLVGTDFEQSIRLLQHMLKGFKWMP